MISVVIFIILFAGCEKLKMSFEGTYLHDGWADLSQIWNGRCTILREY